MEDKLSLVMITYNAQVMLEKVLLSVKGLVDEIVIVDSYSNDNTIKIAKKYNARIYYKIYKDEGEQRNFGLEKVTCEWILTLDADEIVSPQLKKDIIEILKNNTEFVAFKIPYQNFFLGRTLNYGGENYEMIRLFRKNYGYAQPYQIHSQYKIKKGKIGILTGKIYHYSYQSLSQLYIKFTQYAMREAKVKKSKKETTSIKKIFLYPFHMFWTRFIEEKGYKDGLIRIPLDLGFAYMEFLTYFLLLFV